MLRLVGGRSWNSGVDGTGKQLSPWGERENQGAEQTVGKKARCGVCLGRVVQLFALEPGFKVPLGLKGVDK